MKKYLNLNPLWGLVPLVTLGAILAYILHPYFAIWLYQMGSELYHASWIIILLASIGFVTLLGFIGMMIQVLIKNPGKTHFHH